MTTFNFFPSQMMTSDEPEPSAEVLGVKYVDATQASLMESVEYRKFIRYKLDRGFTHMLYFVPKGAKSGAFQVDLMRKLLEFFPKEIEMRDVLFQVDVKASGENGIEEFLTKFRLVLPELWDNLIIIGDYSQANKLKE